ncbi:MAG: 30S ribosomal protein S13 [bacterium]|nr:30S ribosomal protein S13 [bacterium]
MAVARIVGVVIPPEKRVEIALTYVYGVGRVMAKKLLAETGIDSSIRSKDLSEEQIKMLNTWLEKNIRTEGDLRRERLQSIKRLKEIGSYRGSRHSRGLPARGQRTKTNNRTVRGNIRRTMGSGRRASAEKT